MEKSSVTVDIKLIIGIIVSTLLLQYIIQLGNDVASGRNNENGPIMALILIFMLGVNIGIFYLNKYKFIILISGSIAYVYDAYKMFSDLNEYNLWPIALVLNFFIILGPYYFGAYISSNYLLGKSKK